ncbi:chaperone protein dnaJ C76, chloroplastic [Argentina anserina]|uniref:chaperone protein dnaJ C76, chloroplastic n=1 Tax=Argentina anserina TaxID=57926 RepID=UPI0021762845|nr:chaperone protein dnaJ C76, chloroplastic [Potentilla anserina]
MPPPVAATGIACLPLHVPSPTSTCSAPMVVSRTTSPKTSSWGSKIIKVTRWRCRARASSSSGSDITDFDLYDLMGIDSSSDHSEIRRAYRTLQKKCHPDIAGAAGHDMAIILNEAYALLSDPNQRHAYDKEHSKIAELRGYSGKPLYSSWYGSETEERAVFVDEVKCIGCLKCALCAEKTFAIESVYGRARVVGQWADPEHKIQQAIEACPVDCISYVERSNLAALEFLMSKQPRGNVRIGMGNSAGIRVSNIFVEVKKFQTRFQEAKEKASAKNVYETDLQREARVSAIQAIRSISNWLYWIPFASAGETSSKSTKPLQHLRLLTAHKESSTEFEPNIGKIRDAAAARKQPKRNSNRQTSAMNGHISTSDDDDYWIPSSNSLPAAASTSQSNSDVSRSSEPVSSAAGTGSKRWKQTTPAGENVRRKRNPIIWVAPVGPAMVASVLVARLQGNEVATVNDSTSTGGGGLTEHIYGSVALDIINSSWLQIVLAGITWYIIGTIIVGFADAIINFRVGKEKRD